MLSGVYWPPDRAKRIEDFGSSQRAYGPGRFPPPRAVGTISFKLLAARSREMLARSSPGSAVYSSEMSFSLLIR